jgi:hypothetical protein
MSHPASTDLDWLAFQYVNDELTADDAEQFEARLSEDQAAREAVAQAVLLCQAVAAGAKDVVLAASDRRSWLLHVAWAAASAAACLALVFVLRSPVDRPTTPVAQHPGLSDLTSEELALVWVQSLAPPDAAIADEDDLSLVADTLERELVVPPWMLEALGGSQEAAPSAPERKES